MSLFLFTVRANRNYSWRMRCKDQAQAEKFAFWLGWEYDGELC